MSGSYKKLINSQVLFDKGGALYDKNSDSLQVKPFFIGCVHLCLFTLDSAKSSLIKFCVEIRAEVNC